MTLDLEEEETLNSYANPAVSFSFRVEDVRPK